MKTRKSTTCEACGLSSWNGRVCRDCHRYYGGDADNCIAAARQAHAMDHMTYDEVVTYMAGLVDVIVPDWPGPSLPALLYQASAAQIRAADAPPVAQPPS